MSNDNQENRINRCQPGHGASCALCCGSHNYSIPPEDIEELFLVRGCDSPERPIRHPEEARAGKLFRDAMQCPHVGMQSPDPGLVCCLEYSNIDRGEEFESYFTGTCKNFYCQAWHDLTDRQVLFAARLMGDWYYYSLFINDIEAVHDFHAAYGEPDNVPPDELRSLKMELVEKLLEEDGK
jgi:hypothetical protein